MKTMIDLMFVACLSRVITISFLQAIFFDNNFSLNLQICCTIFVVCSYSRAPHNHPLFNVDPLFPPHAHQSFILDDTKDDEVMQVTE